jgi:two-component sensor histidine kinase
VALSSRQALSLGLVVHELATNAAKYGALSNPESGCVRVNWRVEAAEDGGGRLNLLWREQDGPAVAAPGRRGFGSQLIERGVSELGGEISKDWNPDGVVCRISVPL